MKQLLLLSVLLSGCMIQESQMDACRKACAPQSVLHVSWKDCTCMPSVPSGAKNGEIHVESR